MESAFPRPFCALAPSTPVLSAFAEEFGAGLPELRLEVSGGKVSAVDLLRGAPCGLTDALAQRVLGCAPEQLTAEVERHHATHPCFGSTQLDPATGYAAFAWSCEQHRAAVAKALAES